MIKPLKIGNLEVGIRELENHFELKNQSLFAEYIQEKMLKNPTLFVDDNLFLLNQIENNLFELKDSDAVFDALVKKNEDLLDTHLGTAFNVEVESRREVLGGDLAVIVPFFNAGCSPEMKANVDTFLANINHPHVFVAEVAFGEDKFLIPKSEEFIRLRAPERSFMWQKEKMLNLALKKLPERFRNVAWVDADILFDNPNWAQETVEKLNQYCFVQMFSTADWLDKDGSAKYYFHSIVKKKSDALKNLPEGYPKGFHPGFAWAGRREILDKVGFFDKHVAGNGDSFMFYSMVGTLNAWNYQMIKKLLGFSYCFMRYRKLMRAHADGSVGYVEGNIRHLYHGEYEKRNYVGRQDILIYNDFDPLEDLITNDLGLFEWNSESPKSEKILRALRGYLTKRE